MLPCPLCVTAPSGIFYEIYHENTSVLTWITSLLYGYMSMPLWHYKHWQRRNAHVQYTSISEGGEDMDDVRQAAEERASRPKKAPVGASFESERQRSKNALVKQIDFLHDRQPPFHTH